MQVDPKLMKELKQVDRRRTIANENIQRAKRNEPPIITGEDLRDDVLSKIYNEIGRGETSFQIVNARGGPSIATLRRWEDKKVLNPQIGKLRAAGRAAGWDLQWVKLK